MDKKIFITGMGKCREAPVHIETPKAVKTVLKAEELSLAAVSSALKQVGNLGLDTGIVFGIDNSIDRCKAEFFKGLLQEGPVGASPLLFPYTSHNAITAQTTIAFVSRLSFLFGKQVYRRRVAKKDNCIRVCCYARHYRFHDDIWAYFHNSSSGVTY